MRCPISCKIRNDLIKSNKKYKLKAFQRINKEGNEQEMGRQQNGENSNESNLKICAADFEMAFENDIKPVNIY